MSIVIKKENIHGHEYDKDAFFWGVMYKASGSRGKPHIVSLHPRGRDAERIVKSNNRRWEENGWQPGWSLKRFKFYFKGEEIDAYEHTREVKHKKSND